MSVKRKTAFVCTECGYDSPKWFGKCPSCGEWNTMKEVSVQQGGGATTAKSLLPENEPVVISKLSAEQQDIRFPTGIAELDRVLGGGMVKGSLSLISGEPGIGKSTLLLQAGKHLAEQYKVLYVTGEESAAQIKLRADRLSVTSDTLLVYAETRLEQILAAADSVQPQVMIVDSIQTMFHEDVQSTPGSVSQIRECTMRLMQYAKNKAVSVVLVGHVNKDGNIAGPKILEHMVDAVLNFEGERHLSYRMLRAVKNRYGSTNEIGMFEMTNAGLLEVPNPSAALLAGRPAEANGSCVVAALEGTRPLLTEVQGLVTKSAYGAARRTAAGIDHSRAVLLMAILEKRAGFLLGAYDAYVNVVGGMNLDEPAVDLAVVLAIASSYLERPIPLRLAAFGEVGLAGEIRAVSGAEQRIAELERLGFEACLLPADCMNQLSEKRFAMRLIPVRNVQEAIRSCLPGKQEQ